MLRIKSELLNIRKYLIKVTLKVVQEKYLLLILFLKIIFKVRNLKI